MQQRWVIVMAACVAVVAGACGGAAGTDKEPEMLTTTERTPATSPP
jgi:hypothetical protein